VLVLIWQLISLAIVVHLVELMFGLCGRAAVYEGASENFDPVYLNREDVVQHGDGEASAVVAN
jgi:hypothetical protein